MTAISWALEFITGGIGIAIWFLHVAEDLTIIKVLVHIDTFLNFILIPSSYNLNSEVNKALVIANGWPWCNCCAKRTNVGPQEDLEMGVIQNPIREPIRNISGNIRAPSVNQNSRKYQVCDLNMPREDFNLQNEGFEMNTLPNAIDC